MFENVIVAVNGRSGGRDAAALARRLLGSRGRLTLVHVHLETTAVVVHEFDSPAREEGRRLLRDEREAVGGEADLAHVGGTSLAVGLHRYAEEHSADLLVVGADYGGVAGRILKGDDSRSSLQCAPCAVAVSPSGYADSPRPIEIIGVGYDDSAESQAVLAGIERRLSQLDRVEVRQAHGPPVEELGAFAEEVDLLLLGSGKGEPKGRVVLDRTSKSLALSLRCPLLILPSAPAEADSVASGDFIHADWVKSL